MGWREAEERGVGLIGCTAFKLGSCYLPLLGKGRGFPHVISLADPKRETLNTHMHLQQNQRLLFVCLRV